MQNRKPITFVNLIRTYNVVQIVSNIYFLSHILYYAYYLLGFSIYCQPPGNETGYLYAQRRLTSITHFYVWVRIVDFLDTVFFVLAKKQSHVSFLHVYHHICVVGNSYFYIRQGWGNFLAFGAVLNSFIHIIMYSYYFLSTFKAMKPYLWWKKYLTGMQIAQFCVMGGQVLVVSLNNCGYPKSVVYNGLGNVVLLLALFCKFYVQNYNSRIHQKQKVM